ncbi:MULTISPECIES: winged helix-turn-helix transcriptional regulator [unclassified Clostridioides]|nr:winged helix-turn-helix transcriptional regulator [Clostridioides sp. ES-S-0049-03]MCC0677543.1 winged helix-turn-helix transcriptional regulator [Clostridioides sp. ES-W-0018-02]MCC0712217.1 winged helix-turn-helix transcriptional regulator [Clostridioides sp. ES-W-0017-02]
MSYEVKRVIPKITNGMMIVILQVLESVGIVNRKKFNEHEELI